MQNTNFAESSKGGKKCTQDLVHAHHSPTDFLLPTSLDMESITVLYQNPTLEKLEQLWNTHGTPVKAIFAETGIALNGV